jgi:hypothetical protein
MLTEPVEVFLSNIGYFCPIATEVDWVRHLYSKVSGIKFYENQHDASEVITSVQTDKPTLIGTPPSVSETV